MVPHNPKSDYYPYNIHPTQSHINSHLPPPSSSSSGLDRSLPSARSPSPSSVAHALALPSPEAHALDIDSPFDLLEGLMNPDSTRRMTPRDTLYPFFLADPSEPEDDESSIDLSRVGVILSNNTHLQVLHGIGLVPEPVKMVVIVVSRKLRHLTQRTWSIAGPLIWLDYQQHLQPPCSMNFVPTAI